METFFFSMEVFGVVGGLRVLALVWRRSVPRRLLRVGTLCAMLVTAWRMEGLSGRGRVGGCVGRCQVSAVSFPLKYD